MDWWIWIIAGLMLALIEIITPGGFYIFFFGVGALAVGLLGALGLAGSAPLQVLLFSIISLGALWLFRRRLLEHFSPPPQANVDGMLGAAAVALSDIAPGAVAKVELRGSPWTAKNAGAGAIASGQRCIVERVEGISLIVRAETE